jgi:hypothetical protein
MAKVDRVFVVVDLILIGVMSYLAATLDGWLWIVVGILAGGFRLGFVIRHFRTNSSRRSN